MQSIAKFVLELTRNASVRIFKSDFENHGKKSGKIVCGKRPGSVVIKFTRLKETFFQSQPLFCTSTNNENIPGGQVKWDTPCTCSLNIEIYLVNETSFPSTL